ncbi:catalase [Rhodobacter sp. KR11]|uniref:catalase n=1 Tax=Rhodobacter sp. KR11 TaxID=2974588 RepID=UPI002222193B|nr:catalase [Rhodobacter sp. KR11]MCW1917497.1 catalase [Rhodobacter sp. KR11]
MDTPFTTDHGRPIPTLHSSLRAGARGPVLMEDFLLREKLFHFDHERIPERIVHARGTGAHGVFECVRAIPELTSAGLFQKAGTQVPVFARFSTVAGSQGSKDTARDVRGFAVKFYTDQGNWDLVGNNMPVFFIQDAMKFPDLVHAVKPEADRGFPQASSAHDTFWDFISLMPESLHMILWVMSDRALPRSLRMMEGFGVHAFRLINAAGEAHFVKFLWKPHLGLQSHLWDEAVKLAGADPDFHRRDLWEAIETGDFPAWDLAIQVLTEAEAAALPFDILDPTKLIPEELVAPITIGTMTLNRNPDNHFAEVEQVAFLPSNLLPGMDFSDDPLLQGRLFSYLDTQKSRLGTANFAQTPINAPRCPMRNFHADGMMQMGRPKGRVTYEPNSLAPEPEPVFPTQPGATGSKQRPRPFADPLSQALMFWRSQSLTEQDHIVAALVFELGKVTLAAVRLRMLDCLARIDETLGGRVAEGLGAAAPTAAALPPPLLSPQLSILFRVPPVKGRVIGVLVSDGAPDAELTAVLEAAEVEGLAVKIIAPRIGGVDLASGQRLVPDLQLDGSPSVLFDAVALVVSEQGARLLAQDKAAVDFVADAFAHLKALAHGPQAAALLARAGVRPDDFILSLPAEAGRLAARVSQRHWPRNLTQTNPERT